MPHEAPRVAQLAVRPLDEPGGLGLDLRGGLAVAIDLVMIALFAWYLLAVRAAGRKVPRGA